MSQLHHSQGLNTPRQTFSDMGRVKRSEPSEQHEIALGKEGVRKPEIKLIKFPFQGGTRIPRERSKIGKRRERVKQEFTPHLCEPGKSQHGAIELFQGVGSSWQAPR
jgi:hypothetical protein